MEVSGKLHALVALHPGKEPPVLIGEKAGWASEPVWSLWRRDQSSTAGNRTPAFQLVASRYTDWAIPSHLS
jgi:hypothetical protein